MSTEEARKLFVAGLPDTVSEDVLRQLFEATGGTVVEVSLPKDRTTGRPRGFGFVTLASDAEAQRARDTLDGSLQAGKAISVRPFQAEPPRREAGAPRGPGEKPGAGPPGAYAPDRTLYVGNLPYDTSQLEVETLFTACNAGTIVRISLPADDDGRKRGFGFVTMESAEVANASIEALRGADLRGRSLIVNLAHPKGERPAREPGGYAGAGGGGGGPPRFGGAPSFSGPPAGGGGGPARRGAQHYEKRKGPTEGEASARKKSWDRERGGGGRGRNVNDWEE